MYRCGISSPLRRGAGISGPARHVAWVVSAGVVITHQCPPPLFMGDSVFSVILGAGAALPLSLSSWGLPPGSRYINLFASANSNLICVVYKIYGHHKFVRALRGILMTWAPWSSHGVTMGTKYLIMPTAPVYGGGGGCRALHDGGWGNHK